MGVGEDLWAILIIIISIWGVIYATWEWIKPSLPYLILGTTVLLSLSSFVTMGDEYTSPITLLLGLACIAVMIAFVSGIINKTRVNALFAKWNSKTRRLLLPLTKIILRDLFRERSEAGRRAMPK
jgi:hypothetical protein